MNRDTLFETLASAQRAKPEHAMLQLQHSQIAQEYGWCCEHVGDLTHRMSEKFSFFEGNYTICKDKVDKTARALRDPARFQREMLRQIASNVSYVAEKVAAGKFYSAATEKLDRAFPTTTEAALSRLEERGRVYAAEHRKLAVFNRVQQQARMAAVKLGEMQFESVHDWLFSLQLALGEGEAAWTEKAGKIDFPEGKQA